MCTSDIFLGLLAILFPPIAVWVKTGLCSADSLINILLCMLGFIPGLLHAWYIIAKYPDPSEALEYQALPQDAESGRVTYIIVQGPSGHQQRVAKPHPGQQYHAHPQGGAIRGYGTVEQQNVYQGQNGSWGVGGQQGGVVSGAPSQQDNAAGSSSRREDENGAVPPTYAEAVKGDHKVQTHD